MTNLSIQSSHSNFLVKSCILAVAIAAAMLSTGCLHYTVKGGGSQTATHEKPAETGARYTAN